MNYRFDGKGKTLALGIYNRVSLAEACRRRDKAHEMIAAGVDPVAEKKEAKRAARMASSGTLETVAREWLGKHLPTLSPGYGPKIVARLERDIFPWLGKRPIAEITAPELLESLRRIEARSLDTAARARQECGQIWNYAIATGYALHNPARGLRATLPSVRRKHYASITDPVKAGEMLRAFDAFRGAFPVECSLRLAPMLFVRPGELRRAQWADIDLDAG